MRSALALFLAAPLIALPARAADREPLARNTVAVIMDFDQPYSPASVEAMERELESIMSSSEVYLAFRVLDPSAEQEAFPNLVVARFRGRCRSGGEPLERRTHTLGLTHVSDGQILPFSDVDCDKIRGMMEPGLVHENYARGDQLLGRALGRVLAHELYHILGKTSVHAEKGLAKSSLTLRELLTGRFLFQPAESEKIRRAVTPPEPVSTRSTIQP